MFRFFHTLALFFALCSSYSSFSQLSFVSNCSPYPNYTVSVAVVPVSITVTNNGGGCNINVYVAYTVTVNGTIPNGWCGGGGGGSLNNLHINFSCGSGSFDAHLPHVAGTGTVCACNNQGLNSPSQCSTLTVNSYCANTTVNVQISGPGINSTGNIVNPLPIELVSFDASKINTGVLLNWRTATEQNNDYFSIQKSRNGYDWSSIAQIKGAGTSIQQHAYTYTDEAPYRGMNYYQLKQTDFDGVSAYSQIRAVDCSGSSSSSVYPNPTQGHAVNLLINAASNDAITVEVINTLGQSLSKQTVSEIAQQDGNIHLSLDLPEQESVVYVIVSQNNSIINRHKVCITKN